MIAHPLGSMKSDSLLLVEIAPRFCNCSSWCGIGAEPTWMRPPGDFPKRGPTPLSRGDVEHGETEGIGSEAPFFGRFRVGRFKRGEGNRNPSPLLRPFGDFWAAPKVTRRRNGETSSSQAPYLSLRPYGQSSFTPLLLLSKSNPLRWASIWLFHSSESINRSSASCWALRRISPAVP